MNAKLNQENIIFFSLFIRFRCLHRLRCSLKNAFHWAIGLLLVDSVWSLVIATGLSGHTLHRTEVRSQSRSTGLPPRLYRENWRVIGRFPVRSLLSTAMPALSGYSVSIIVHRWSSLILSVTPKLHQKLLIRAVSIGKVLIWELWV